MSLPSHTTNGQSSIRSFFRPKQQPVYAAPPSSSSKSKSPPTSAAPATTTAQQPAAATTSSRPANLHPQASISRIKPEHIPALRRITSLLLPVNYPDSFYARLSDPLSSGAFSRVILWRDDRKDPSAPGKVIGGLVCRPEPSPFHAGTVDSPSKLPRGPTLPSAQPNALYIQSLVLLSPYRGLGLAAALLDEVIADAAHSEFACESVWAHVWTQNEEGLRWYTARGFACVDELKKYYYKLHPDSAWIVRREIGPGAALGLDNSVSAAGASGETEIEGPGRSVTAAVANLLPASTATASPSPSPGITPPPPLEALSKTSSSRPPPSPLPNSSRSTPGQSFQNTRPETEWNDLPADMQSSKNGSGNLSVPGSGASSRSSSSARKRRDRAYPAAAFGN
ncbi:acyl-CoA N-acyltransferase [Nemania abortiva]|nr:acyl-CoA N-acyltransferase [Nemania abortiva]